MDLSETGSGTTARHPWEIARRRSLEAILRDNSVRFESVLDIGCGDGFLLRELRSAFGPRESVGLDVYLPAEACVRSEDALGSVELLRDPGALGARRFDLVLALDVIEHVADDRALLRSISTERLLPNGWVLVTVPAFQQLFSDHDRALSHYRRYSLAELRSALQSSGLRIVSDGYLFASLLFARCAQKLLELGGIRPDTHGIGNWQGGAVATRLLLGCLSMDNALLLRASRSKLRLPGLSAWALCKAS